MLPSLNLSKIYKIQYVHPKTGEVLEGCFYLEKGVKKKGSQHFLVNGEWLKEADVPERRKWRKENNSSLRGFFIKIKSKMKEKNENMLAKGRYLIG